MLQDWILRSRSLFRRSAVERELDDELRFHLEQQVAALTRGGLSRDEAIRRARLDLGGLDQIKEEHRDSRGVQLITDLAGDVHYALRQLRRSPGFATAAIGCLALGIGTTTAIYSVVNTILLQPLPYADSDRLMRVVENVPLVIAGRPPLPNGLNYRGIVEWQAHTTAFDETAAMTSATAIVKTDDGTARLPGSLVSDNLFRMLGIRAMLGRALVPGDDGSPNVVVMTFDAWRRIFHGDPGRIGTAVDLQIPDQPDGRLSFAVRMRGDPASAIPVVSQSVRAVDPDVGIDAMIPMERLAASVVARPRFYMVMLGAFAGVATALAAIGIYGVLTYLVIQRTREIGMRMALGARRRQVLTLILGRGALLTVLGLSLGLAGAAAGARVLRGMLFGVSALDPQTFAAVSVLFTLVALVASYLPARRASNVDPMVALRTD